MVIDLSMLKELPLFSELTSEENALIVRNSHLRRYEHGQFLFMHGETITNFYVICRGTVQIFRETPDGHEVTSNMLIAGDTINTNEIITENPLHSMNARAVDDASLLEIPITWMRENMSNFTYLSKHLMAGLSDRLNSAQRDMEHQSTMSATQIVACFLQRLCVSYGLDPEEFELPYSKTLIASRLHIELETFSRALKKLKEEGITVQGTHVSFTNRQKTSHFVCDECSLAKDCPAHIYLHITLQNTGSN